MGISSNTSEGGGTSQEIGGVFTRLEARAGVVSKLLQSVRQITTSFNFSGLIGAAVDWWANQRRNVGHDHLENNSYIDTCQQMRRDVVCYVCIVL